MAYTVIGSSKTRGFRVLWMLEELGLPFDHVAAGPRSPDALAVNPAGKVPVLQVDGVSLTDSAAILTFLADRHGKFTHPAGTLDRARQDGLTGLILDEVEAVVDRRAPQLRAARGDAPACDQGRGQMGVCPKPGAAGGPPDGAVPDGRSDDGA